MVRGIGIVLLTIVIFSFQCNGEIALATAATTVSIAIKAVRLALQIWEHLQEHHALFLSELKELSENNDLLRTEILIMKDEIVDSVTETVPRLVELNRRFTLVFEKSSRIERSYKDFLLYIEEPENYDAKILNEFALQAISEDKGIHHLLEEIHTNVVLSDTTSPSILHLLIQYIEKYLQYNNISKSPQQLIYDYLNSIIYTEVKGLLTIKFSYHLLEMYQGGNYQGHIDKVEHDFIIRINNTVSVFKESMNVISQELWKNDPAKHREEITYTELKKLFQEMVVNEYDISTFDGCFHECFNYKVPSRKRYPNEKVREECGYEDDICPKQRLCSGYLYNCRKQIDADMYICPSDQKNRRYEFIDYGNQQRYGLPREFCSNDLVRVTRHYKYGLFRFCDPCMCICDDLTTSNSDRYFNLVPSMTQINDNYVITGVRLRKEDNIIHIQIQQGQLLSNGRINRTTVAWMPIYWNSTHIHKLTWDESREVNLDNLQLPKNHVLTGLSFTTKFSHGNHKRLHLEIFSMQIDFESGKLLYDYKLNFTSDPSKSEIRLHDLDIPTRGTAKNNFRSNSNQYLKFGPTGLRHDVGQSTISFIDIQEVTTNPPVPMSGAGIYYKGKSGSGGFMGLKLFTYDFGQHVEANLPETYCPPKRIQTTRLQWFLKAQQLKRSASAVSTNFSVKFSGNLFLLMFIAVLYVP